MKLQYEHKPTMMALLYAKAHGLLEEKRDAETRAMIETYGKQGYPEGLVGESIPLHARIMAIADVFDAVSQKRCYRNAMPLEACFAIIEKGSGTDFDPHLVKLFLDAKEEVTETARKTFHTV